MEKERTIDFWMASLITAVVEAGVVALFIWGLGSFIAELNEPATRPAALGFVYLVVAFLGLVIAIISIFRGMGPMAVAGVDRLGRLVMLGLFVAAFLWAGYNWLWILGGVVDVVEARAFVTLVLFFVLLYRNRRRISVVRPKRPSMPALLRRKPRQQETSG